MVIIQGRPTYKYKQTVRLLSCNSLCSKCMYRVHLLHYTAKHTSYIRFTITSAIT